MVDAMMPVVYIRLITAKVLMLNSKYVYYDYYDLTQFVL